MMPWVPAPYRKMLRVPWQKSEQIGAAVELYIFAPTVHEAENDTNRCKCVSAGPSTDQLLARRTSAHHGTHLDYRLS